MYCDRASNPVNVHYSRSIAESEVLARMFVGERVVGFGMHWLTPGVSAVPENELAPGLDEEYNISLVVLAKEDNICIFQIALHKGNSTEEKIAPTLKRILEASSTLKAGVGIFDFQDTRLFTRFGIKLKGIFELADLHNVVGRQEYSTPKRGFNSYQVPMDDLIEEHLCLEYYDSKTLRLSDWSKSPLSQEQISYAANDAYAGYQLFRTMDAKRLGMEPIRQLPLPAEQQSLEQTRGKESSQQSSLRRRREPGVFSATSPSSQPWTAREELAEESPTRKKRNTSPGPIRRSLFPQSKEKSQEKFIWEQGELIFNFGKHETRSLRDIAANEPSYLKWMLKSEFPFSKDVIKLVRDALNGIFPTEPLRDLDLPLRPVESISNSLSETSPTFDQVPHSG